ncbi:MAG: I78 family peptidase inhibitor [Hyphomonadaceae bacterium]
MLLRCAAALAFALALAACATTPSEEETEQPDTCGRAQFAHLVGVLVTPEIQASLPAGSRVLALGQPITADYRAERLNLWLDDDGRVEALRCF